MSKTVLLDDKYEIGRGIGSWAKSYEPDYIKKGEVRFIGGVLMYAYSVYRKWYRPLNEVNWCPVDKKLDSYDQLRKWVDSL